MIKKTFVLLLAILIYLTSCRAQQTNKYDHAAVVSAHPESTKVGVAIMKQGGNAIDAAVAVQFADEDYPEQNCAWKISCYNLNKKCGMFCRTSG